MRNLLDCKKEDILEIDNLNIHEFMNMVDNVGELFDVEIDEYTIEKYSAFEFFCNGCKLFGYGICNK